jgi:hypothetical protein
MIRSTCFSHIVIFAMKNLATLFSSKILSSFMSFRTRTFVVTIRSMSFSYVMTVLMVYHITFFSGVVFTSRVGFGRRSKKNFRKLSSYNLYIYIYFFDSIFYNADFNAIFALRIPYTYSYKGHLQA